ncbi:hypothetical protein MASR1M68_07370 [Elusimicrobiota bacterium]
MKLNKKIILKSGLIEKNEKWSGNILIDASVTILNGVKVVVAPGTVIKFTNKDVSVNGKQDHKLDFLFNKFNIEKEQYQKRPSINVYGSFFVAGQKDNIIRIGNCGWDGHIFIAKNGSCKFKYVDIKYSFGLIFDYNAKISKIENCLFEQCFFGVVNFSKVIVKNSEFRFNIYGIASYDKCITYNNILYENLKCAIMINSPKKSYAVSNYFFLNNDALNYTQSSEAFIKNNILYCNSSGFSVSDSSGMRILNNIFFNHDIGLQITGNSFDVHINQCIYSGSAIYVFDESAVEIHNCLVVVCDVGIKCREQTKVLISKSNFFDNKVNFMLFDNSCVEILESNSYSFNINIILYGQTSLFSNKSNFDSKNYLYLNFDNSLLDISDSQIKGQDFLHSHFFSEAFFKNNVTDVHNFIKIFDYSNVFLEKNNINIFNDGIISHDHNYIFIKETNIFIKTCALLDLKNDEVVIVNDTRIKGLFCKSLNNPNLQLKNSSIEERYNNIEIFDGVYVNIENTHIEGDVSVNGTSSITVKNSATGSISVAGLSSLIIDKTSVKGNILSVRDSGDLDFKDSTVICNMINVSGNGELEIDASSFELQEAVSIQESGKLTARNSVIKSHNTVIIKSGFEAMECEDSEISGVRGIIIEEGRDNIFKRVKVNSEEQGIFISEISEINMDSVEIDSGGLGLKIHGDKVEILEGVKIKAKEAIETESGLIYIRDCEIEGRITANGLKNITVEQSEVGAISVLGLGVLKLYDSKAKGREINISGSGELEIDASSFELQEAVSVQESGKLTARNSVIKSHNTVIIKSGFEAMECEDSEISGVRGIIIEEGRDNIFNRVKVKSGEQGIFISEISEINMDSVEIDSGGLGLKIHGDKVEILEGVKIKAKEAIETESGLIYIRDCEIEGRITANGLKNITVEQSEVGAISVLGLGVLKLYDSKAKGREINISGSGELDIEGSNIELEDGIDILESGKLRLITSDIKSRNVAIRQEGFEIMECLDSELKGIKGIVIDDGQNHIFKRIKINSSSIAVLINAISSAYLESVEIDSEGAGIRLEGDRKEKFDSIKIKALESIEVNNGEIEITNSELGKITTSGISSINIAKSNIASISIVDLGSMSLKNSDVTGSEVSVKESGELEIEDSNLELEEWVDVIERGKLKIKRSRINSGNTGIRKDGFETIECEDTKVSGIQGIIIEDGRDNIFKRVKVKSGLNGILIKGNSRIQLENVEIESKAIGIELQEKISEKFESVKIKAKEIIRLNDSDIEIVNGEMEGNITTGGINLINTANSKLGSVTVVGLGLMHIVDCDVKGKEINIEGNAELKITKSKLNLEEGMGIIGYGKLSMSGIDLKSLKTGISKEGFETIECEDVEISSINGIILNEGIDNFFTRVKIKSEEDGISLNKNSDVYLESVEIDSKGFGLYIEGYRDKQIEDIKIKAKEIIGMQDGNISVINSELEGNLTTKNINFIDVKNSNVGSIETMGLGFVNLTDCNITGRELNVRGNGETNLEYSSAVGEGLNISENGSVNIKNSNLELNVGINVIESGKLSSFESNIKSENIGIRKEGFEVFKCKKTGIQSVRGIVIEDGIGNILSGVKLKSEKNGLLLKENSEVLIDLLEIDSNGSGIELEGDRSEKFDSIKIKAKEIIDLENGQITINNSELEGIINIEGLNKVDITDSNIGSLSVVGLGVTNIFNSNIQSEISAGANGYINLKNNIIEGLSINASANGEIAIEESRAKLEDGVSVTDLGKVKITGSRIGSENTGINKEGIEVIEVKGSQIEGTNGIVIEEGVGNVLRGVKVKSSQNGILIKGESRAELKDIEIESSLLGIDIDGNNYEKIEGIKIKAEEAVDIGSGEIEIIDSEIEGRITAKGIDSIGIVGSKVGGLSAISLGVIGVRESEIEGLSINASANGEIAIEESRAKLEDGVSVTDLGKVKITGSRIGSENTGINKEGIEVIEVKGSQIEGTNGIVIEEGVGNVLRGVKVKSSQNGILIKGESRAELKDIEIESSLLGIDIDGNNYEKIEGIKIKAEEAVDIGSGEIEIIDSEIEGRITAKGIDSIGIVGSKVGGLSAISLGVIGVRESEIEGLSINASANGEIAIEESRAKLEDGVSVTDLGKVKITGSRIGSENTGINKEG